MTAQVSRQRKRIEWMWKSNANPWSHSEPEEWHPYSDVETVIIEEAYKKKQSEALLDDYHIDFKQVVQISNNNLNNQRPVKRMITDEQRESILREERFMPHAIIPSTPFSTADSFRGRFFDALISHYKLSYISPLSNRITRRMMVDKAAEGIIIEAKLVGKQKEGEWMAQELPNVEKRSLFHGIIFVQKIKRSNASHR